MSASPATEYVGLAFPVGLQCVNYRVQPKNFIDVHSVTWRAHIASLSISAKELIRSCDTAHHPSSRMSGVRQMGPTAHLRGGP